MLWRVRNSRGRPINAPAAFIHPCQPIVAKQAPSERGWAHELKHDGYRLQIHVRDGRVRLYTITGADWSKRYPLIVEAAGKINGNAILDAEVVWPDPDGISQFDALHSRVNDAAAIALAFDLLMHNGEDVRRKPFAERKAILRKVVPVAAFNTSSTPKATAWKCSKPFASLAWRALSQRSSTRRTSPDHQRRG
jgi:bifunctional non-homologous end joining protein LigD